MTPAELQSQHFATYPVEAKKLVVSELPLLRRLPLTYVALLLREVIEYDWKFPAERKEIDSQFAYLASSSDAALQREMVSFLSIRLAADLEASDWVKAPGAFSEKLSAYLWASHQIDAFHQAATDFMRTVHAYSPSPAPATGRLGIVAIGQGVGANSYQLFRKLRPYGVHFTQVNPSDGCRTVLEIVNARAKAYRQPYGHWYLDGGTPLAGASDDIESISYEGVRPVRVELLSKIKKAMMSGTGSEAMRTMLAEMQPQQLGLAGDGPAGLLNRFQISLLTQGSGTQIYSTTFVQWAAREVLRRAQPLTLFARFAPRQRDRSLEEMLNDAAPKEMDVKGSLIDADMGAFYTWVNQERLPGADKAGFLAWFEEHNEAVAIGRYMPRATASSETIDLKKIVDRLQHG